MLSMSKKQLSEYASTGTSLRQIYKSGKKKPKK